MTERELSGALLVAGTTFGLALIMLGLLLIVSSPQTPKEVQYNCELSEISPDYPIKVKALCRELRK